jgi:hypothetical protein
MFWKFAPQNKESGDSVFGFNQSKKMKKLLIQVLLLATMAFFTSCKFTAACPTYGKSNKKTTIKAAERSHKHMAKKVYKPGRFYY